MSGKLIDLFHSKSPVLTKRASKLDKSKDYCSFRTKIPDSVIAKSWYFSNKSRGT
jgi:hypothetical protein